jgi:hypothetical protein
VVALFDRRPDCVQFGEEPVQRGEGAAGDCEEDPGGAGGGGDGVGGWGRHFVDVGCLDGEEWQDFGDMRPGEYGWEARRDEV